MCHYLDDFIAIFSAKTTKNQIYDEELAYIWITDLLGIPRKDSKNCEGTELPIFGIEIDSATFTARLPQDKLERAIRKTGEVLKESIGSISYIDIQSLVGFFSLSTRKQYG